VGLVVSAVRRMWEAGLAILDHGVVGEPDSGRLGPELLIADEVGAGCPESGVAPEMCCVAAMLGGWATPGSGVALGPLVGVTGC
jgi:hypothetical protein